MISFNTNSVFNLKPIPVENVRNEVSLLLLPGETILATFKTVRDQLIFTTTRIISIDVQGLTGTRKSYGTLPYNKIQFFSAQTPSIAEIIPDSELVIWFASGSKAVFEFRGGTDVFEIARIIGDTVCHQK